MLQNNLTSSKIKFSRHLWSLCHFKEKNCLGLFEAEREQGHQLSITKATDSKGGLETDRETAEDTDRNSGGRRVGWTGGQY